MGVLVQNLGATSRTPQSEFDYTMNNRNDRCGPPPGATATWCHAGEGSDIIDPIRSVGGCQDRVEFVALK